MKVVTAKFKYSKSTNGNSTSPDFNKTIYYCSVESTSEEIKGCPLGRSYDSNEAAKKDLINFVEFESEVTLQEEGD